MPALQSLFGVLALLAIAWVFSENRAAVSWRKAAIGLSVTVVLALLLLKIPQLKAAFSVINGGVMAVSAATRAGTSFVFGYLGGAPAPFEVKRPGGDFIFAFQALPVILIMSVLTTVFFYWKILPPIVIKMT